MIHTTIYLRNLSVSHGLYSKYHCSKPTTVGRGELHIPLPVDPRETKPKFFLGGEETFLKKPKYVKCFFNESLRWIVRLKLCSSQAWKEKGKKDDRHEFHVVRSKEGQV